MNFFIRRDLYENTRRSDHLRRYMAVINCGNCNFAACGGIYLLISSMRTSKTITLGKMKKKTWDVFSIYIRRRDCLTTMGSEDEGKCFTCDKVVPFIGSHAGHFVPGRHSSVLFDERNSHLQCVGCNVFKSGNLIEYFPRMVAKYGHEVVEDLKAKDREIKKFSRGELQDLFNKYTLLINE